MYNDIRTSDILISMEIICVELLKKCSNRRLEQSTRTKKNALKINRANFLKI